MAIFVNRTLNLKKIKLVGFDMDYTLVPYHTRKFEELTHRLAKEQLIRWGYPEDIRVLDFDFHRAIVGLVIDKRYGNLLQLNRYNKVKLSYHGLNEISFSRQNELYSNVAVDLSDKDYQSLDTSFAISYGVLFSQLVQMKDDGAQLPDYHRIDADIMQAIDQIHRDGSLKEILRSNFADYVIDDPETAPMLERLKQYGKKLMIITNSDYEYTRALLDYALTPHLMEHDSWLDLFDLIITLAQKPRFFEQGSNFLKVDPETGLMSNWIGPINSGIFQGGCYTGIQEGFGFQGKEILYIGDHIYGDVVSIKKRCSWRTALVLGDLEEEMQGLRNAHTTQLRIDSLMDKKGVLEKEINILELQRHDGRQRTGRKIDRLFRELDSLNSEISALIARYKSHFNPYWGEILRAGSEESLYAEQVEEYACIYMTRVSDLFEYSPRTYFRPIKRIMPHELTVIREEQSKECQDS